jgi:hypothetical protein
MAESVSTSSCVDSGVMARRPPTRSDGLFDPVVTADYLDPDTVDQAGCCSCSATVDSDEAGTGRAS